MFLVLLVAACINLRPVYCSHGSYHWRDFDGSIPRDAFVGGKDSKKRDIYIGQAVFADYGLFPLEIFKNQTTFYAPQLGANPCYPIENNMKILCADTRRLYWEYHEKPDFTLNLIGKHPVIGGNEVYKGRINIGRIQHNGGHKIGKINTFSPELLFYYVADDNNETSASSYEILLHD